MTPLLRPVTKMKCSMPASLASSTTYWISGLSTMVSISFGIALVAGRTRVPRPATGKTALRIFMRYRGAIGGRAESEVRTLVAGLHLRTKADVGRAILPQAHGKSADVVLFPPPVRGMNNKFRTRVTPTLQLSPTRGERARLACGAVGGSLRPS